MDSRYINSPLKDPAGTLEDNNYGSPYPPQNPGTCEYYISFTWYVTKYLLAHPFHTQYIPQPQPFRYSETPFYYTGDMPEPSIEGNERSATQKSISIEGTPREQSTTSRGAEDNGLLLVGAGENANLFGNTLVKMTKYSSFASTKKHETSYGHKGEKHGMTYFWNLVARDFVEYRGCLPYSAESCRRRVTSKVMRRRAELEKETGREEGYTD